ncbi:hypothetical protein [Actinomadura macrotermitis]|uniref:Uncharacterized protein n=1 Tax=Actinomadura macrotermitis TaxID=2585200 RepID=A0A7K0C4M6_9ACTN|nr:hypothetical protein [Actinomadura macrotermitis]MQY07774.1 hypothetical protein [Actinomadura macrotermitis]
MLGVYADVPWSYAAGAGIALAAAHQLRLGRAGRHFALALLYGGLVFVPASLSVAAAYPEWATLQERASLPGGFLPGLGALELALLAAGFLLTRWAIAAGRTRWAVLQVLLPCLVMAVLLVHGWKRLISLDRAGYAHFPELRRVDDLRPLLAHAVTFLTSGLALTLLFTGALTVGALALIMGILHQFGLTDAGVREGPGLIRAGLAGVITIAGTLAVAALIGLLLQGVGPLGVLAVVPVLWLAIAARGGYASLLVADLALPPGREKT